MQFPAFVVRDKTGVCYEAYTEGEKEQITKDYGGSFLIIPFSDVTNLSKLQGRDLVTNPIRYRELQLKPITQ